MLGQGDDTGANLYHGRMNPDALYLGLDFGTSGARACVIDAAGATAAQAHCHYDLGDWQSWLRALHWLCASLPSRIRERIAAVAIDATSSTVLLCDAQNVPVAQPLLYHDARATSQATRLTEHAPAGHCAANASSSLAKLLYLLQRYPIEQGYCGDQASWLAAMLTGRPGICDYHNALKLGYDAVQLVWPAWLDALSIGHWLPQVVPPGAPLGNLAPPAARKLGLPSHCIVRAGTTDSIAAFIASGAHTPGTAVTSLGSTLVVKLLSTHRVEDARYGIYSHRFGNLWLAGGASNTGGAALRQYFDDAALATLSRQIDPLRDSGLDYYPLPRPGERFPINAPQLAPRVTPRPADDALFLHGLLEGIARIEARAYALLKALGATPVTQVLSAGGGAANPTWSAMRERLLGVPMRRAVNDTAAYGAALLARSGGIPVASETIDGVRVG